MERDTQVSVKEIESPPALVVNVHGGIETWKGLEAVIKIIESSVQELLLVSMKNVDYIDSAGVGKIMAMGYIAKELGKKLRFAGMQPYVRRVFELLDGHHFVQVFESEQEALAAE